VPIHGELRHLKQHAALAREIGIPADRIAVVENGTVIEFRDGAMQIGERVPGGYVFVDGSGVGDVGPTVMRERDALARDGFVVAHLQIDGRTGQLIRAPEIVSRGFVFVQEAEELFERARTLIQDLAANGRGGDLKAQVERELLKLFYAETRRRPMVFVFTSTVN
jgi:ribonuclease J